MGARIQDVISRVESGDNIYAFRYESGWRYATEPLIRKCAQIHKCSRESARNILSMSWGKYQIMGSVLYELGYEQRIIPDFFHPEMQETYFLHYLRSRRIDWNKDGIFNLNDLRTDEGRRFFAAKYNGSGAIAEYAEKIKRAMIELGERVE